MGIAMLASQRSKDPHTQVGAVLVSPDNQLHFIGYNGFPKGLPENEERWERPDKYERVLHAEENALHNRNCRVDGWTCYVTLKPCDHCTLALAQCGVSKIIYLEDREHKLTDQICREMGITIERYVRREATNDRAL